MERGLSFFTKGEDSFKKKRDTATGKALSPGTRTFGFTEQLWGNKTRSFVKTMKRLSDDHWEEVFDYAVPFLNMKTPNSDENLEPSDNDADPESNPRALIDIYWYVPHSTNTHTLITKYGFRFTKNPYRVRCDWKGARLCVRTVAY